jgi:ABC-type Fe3+ transport system permease subunit
MYGFWLLILFGALPAAFGAAVAFLLSKEEKPPRRILLIGAVVGVAVGAIAGVLLAT